MAKRRRFRGAISFWLGIAVSGVFLWLTLQKIEWARFQQDLDRVDLRILSSVLLVKAIGFTLAATRTRVLFSPTQKISLWLALRSVLLGFVGNNVLPLRLGELLRVGFLARSTTATAEATLAIVALERVVDTFCVLSILGLTALVSSVDVSGDIRLILMALFVLAALGGALFAARRPALATQLAEWGSGFLGRRISKAVAGRAARFAEGLAALASARLLGSVLALSFTTWAVSLTSVQVVLWAFGLSLPWHAPLVVVVFLAFGTMLPSSPSFVGTYHYFGAMALVLLGVPEETAAAFAVVMHFMAFLPFTVLALPIVGSDLVRTFRGGGESDEVPEDASTP